MIYPDFLKTGDTIGISAPSAGVGRKLEDYSRSILNLEKMGFSIKETKSVRVNDLRSADAKTRGEEFTSLFKDNNVDFVMAAAGGDFLDEILPYVDFKTMKKHPKWVMGASDPTGILYPYTTGYDVATMYGLNAGDYSDKPYMDYVKKNLKLIQGEDITQKSYSKCMKTPTFLAKKIELDTPNKWKCSEKTLSVSGRCIGGCIDGLKDLIGTKFDQTKKFIKKYQKDGFVWYFDNFSMSAENLYRTFLQMRYAGYFDGAKVIILGRTLFESNETGMTYDEAILKAFPGIPVLYDADIGHTLPRFTMINGAIAEVNFKNSHASIHFVLK